MIVISLRKIIYPKERSSGNTRDTQDNLNLGAFSLITIFPRVNCVKYTAKKSHYPKLDTGKNHRSSGFQVI